MLPNGAVVIVAGDVDDAGRHHQRDCPRRQPARARRSDRASRTCSGASSIAARRTRDGRCDRRKRSTIAACRCASHPRVTRLSLSCTCLSEDFDDVLAIVAGRRAQCVVSPSSEVDKRRAESVSAIRQDDDNPAVRAVESAVRDALRRSASVRPPRQGLDGERRALHSRRPRSLPRGALRARGAVAGHRRRRRAVARSRAGGDGARRVGGDSARGAGTVPPPASAAAAARVVHRLPGKSQSDIAYGFTTIRRLDPRY